jgi:hypothetical protein
MKSNAVSRARSSPRCYCCRLRRRLATFDFLLLTSDCVQVQVTLQLTVSKPVRLGIEPLLGLFTRFYFVTRLTVTVLCLVGYPIWRGVASGLSFVWSLSLSFVQLYICRTTINYIQVVFWDILPCKIIVDRRFRGAYYLHHQGSVSQANQPTNQKS